MSEIRSIKPVTGDTTQITVSAHDGALLSPYGMDYIFVTYPFKRLGEVEVEFIYYVGDSGGSNKDEAWLLDKDSKVPWYTDVISYHQDKVQSGSSDMHFRLLFRDEGEGAILYTPTSLHFVEAPGMGGVGGKIPGMLVKLKGGWQAVHNVVCADTSYPIGGVDFDILSDTTNSVICSSTSLLTFDRPDVRDGESLGLHPIHIPDAVSGAIVLPRIYLTPGETYTMRFWNPKLYDFTSNIPSIVLVGEHNLDDTVDYRPIPYKPADDYYLRCSSGTRYGIPEDIHVHASPSAQGTNNFIKFTVPKEISDFSDLIVITAGPKIKDQRSLKPHPWSKLTRCSKVHVTVTSPQVNTAGNVFIIDRMGGYRYATLDLVFSDRSMEGIVYPLKDWLVDIQLEDDTKTGTFFTLENNKPIKTDANGRVTLNFASYADKQQSGNAGAMIIKVSPADSDVGKITNIPRGSWIPVYTIDSVLVGPMKLEAIVSSTKPYTLSQQGKKLTIKIENLIGNNNTYVELEVLSDGDPLANAVITIQHPPGYEDYYFAMNVGTLKTNSDGKIKLGFYAVNEPKRGTLVGPMTISVQDPRFSGPPQVVHTFDTVETTTTPLVDPTIPIKLTATVSSTKPYTLSQQGKKLTIKIEKLIGNNNTYVELVVLADGNPLANAVITIQHPPGYEDYYTAMNMGTLTTDSDGKITLGFYAVNKPKRGTLVGPITIRAKDPRFSDPPQVVHTFDTVETTNLTATVSSTKPYTLSEQGKKLTIKIEKLIGNNNTYVELVVLADGDPLANAVITIQHPPGYEDYYFAMNVGTLKTNSNGKITLGFYAVNKPKRGTLVGPMTIRAQDPRSSDPPQVVHIFDTVETNT